MIDGSTRSTSSSAAAASSTTAIRTQAPVETRASAPVTKRTAQTSTAAPDVLTRAQCRKLDRTNGDPDKRASCYDLYGEEGIGMESDGIPKSACIEASDPDLKNTCLSDYGVWGDPEKPTLAQCRTPKTHAIYEKCWDYYSNAEIGDDPDIPDYASPQMCWAWHLNPKEVKLTPAQQAYCKANP